MSGFQYAAGGRRPYHEGVFHDVPFALEQHWFAERRHEKRRSYREWHLNHLQELGHKNPVRSTSNTNDRHQLDLHPSKLLQICARHPCFSRNLRPWLARSQGRVSGTLACGWIWLIVEAQARDTNGNPASEMPSAAMCNVWHNVSFSRFEASKVEHWISLPELFS